MSKPQTIHGVHAPTPRPTLWAALLVAVGLSSAFLTVLSGFAVASRFVTAF